MEVAVETAKRKVENGQRAPAETEDLITTQKFSEATRKPINVGKMQESRFERKYIIDERQVEGIRDVVLEHLQPDEFTVGKPGRGYLVNSLYFDSPDLVTYRDTEQGSLNRFKLRIRFYDENPNTPCFLEVKRRHGERIIKTRAAVTREAAERFARTGHPITEEDLMVDSPSHREGLYNFMRLAMLINAQPATFVSYYREGFERNNDNHNRVTFDRDVRASKFTGNLTAADRDQWAAVPMEGTVLEMKYTDSHPKWMEYIVRRMSLVYTSFKKYISSAETINPLLTRWGNVAYVRD